MSGASFAWDLQWIQAAKDAWDVFRPGGQLHPQYFLEHKWNFIFEGILLVVIAYMFLQRSTPKKKHDKPLSEKVLMGYFDERLCCFCYPASMHARMPGEAMTLVQPAILDVCAGGGRTVQ